MRNAAGPTKEFRMKVVGCSPVGFRASGFRVVGFMVLKGILGRVQGCRV